MKMLLSKIAIVLFSVMSTYGAAEYKNVDCFIAQIRQTRNEERYSLLVDASLNNPIAKIRHFASYELGVIEYEGKYSVGHDFVSARERFQSLLNLSLREPYVGRIKVGATYYLAMMDSYGRALPDNVPNLKNAYIRLLWVVRQSIFFKMPHSIQESAKMELDYLSLLNLD